MTDGSTSRPRLVAIGTISGAGLAALAALQSSPHAGPGAAPGWRRWLWSIPARSADPLEALAAGARLVAMAVLAYLVLIAAANVTLSFLPAAHRRSRTWRTLQSLTPRWLAVASIGVAIGAGPVAAQQPAGPTDGRAAPVMELLDASPSRLDSGSTGPPSTTRAAVPTPTSTVPLADDDTPLIDPSSPLQPIPDEATDPLMPTQGVTSGEAAESGRTGPPTQTASPALPSVEQRPAAAPELPSGDHLPSTDQLPPSVAVHRVQPGEHFWSIAEQVVIERVGPTASDADVAAYWRQLVEVNRDRLVDPDNPDLILPGQVFDLPW